MDYDDKNNNDDDDHVDDDDEYNFLFLFIDLKKEGLKTETELHKYIHICILYCIAPLGGSSAIHTRI